jgi:hypothetical protein
VCPTATPCTTLLCSTALPSKHVHCRSLSFKHCSMTESVLQSELKVQAASRDDTGPYFGSGAVTRLQRRVLGAQDPTLLNLSHSLWGQSQMAVVQVPCPCLMTHKLASHSHAWLPHQCLIWQS